MKPNFPTLGAIALAIAMFVTGCQKTDAPAKEEDNPTTSEVSLQSDDQTRFSAEMEATDAEVLSAIEANADFTGRMDGAAVAASTCNAIVTMENTTTERKMTISFNGADCIGTGTRTGTVQVSMPLNTRWRDAGAVLTVRISNLVITRLSDRKTMTINGTRMLTNVSGGKMAQLFTLGSITHTVASNNMTITFDDGTTRNWHVARKREFTFNGGVVLTVTGNYAADSVSGIAEWGTNRRGSTFSSSISAPLVFRQDCDFRLTSGTVTHHGAPVPATIIFGLNATGNPTTCPGNGSYYYKLSWTAANGSSRSIVRAY